MKKIISAVEKHKELILNAERYIWENPETGFFEYKTNAYMIDAFEKLGYKAVKNYNCLHFSEKDGTK